jgi:hypothetical protein
MKATRRAVSIGRVLLVLAVSLAGGFFAARSSQGAPSGGGGGFTPIYSYPIGPAKEICTRCRGTSSTPIYERCYGSVYGGDYCAGTCDELGRCTCREVGDCDGYAGGWW